MKNYIADYIAESGKLCHYPFLQDEWCTLPADHDGEHKKTYVAAMLPMNNKQPHWDKTIQKVDDYVSGFSLPKIGLNKIDIDKTDILPADPSAISSQQLAEKLSEYSAYVSFLNAEGSRIEAEAFIIDQELSNLVDSVSLTSKLSKAKAKASLLMNDADFRKGERRRIELEAKVIRLNGLRDGFAARMNAASREISRRNQER